MPVYKINWTGVRFPSHPLYSSLQHFRREVTMSQERVQKSKSTAKREEVLEEAEKTDSKEELKNELDELLDEIDSVLEENAEEFIRSYVQKGGQAVRVFINTVIDGIKS